MRCAGGGDAPGAGPAGGLGVGKVPQAEFPFPSPTGSGAPRQPGAPLGPHAERQPRRRELRGDTQGGRPPVLLLSCRCHTCFGISH